MCCEWQVVEVWWFGYVYCVFVDLVVVVQVGQCIVDYYVVVYDWVVGCEVDKCDFVFLWYVFVQCQFVGECCVFG